ncbi:O-antigen ligase family protein [Saccharospirillum sp. HFRX-2]|uniref:O-antigen ligase family protein n=1 Tax=unclassified Saccharospirillum TaxID=2633430 RepID=UPI003724BB87
MVDVLTQKHISINVIRGLLVVYVLSMIGREFVSEASLKKIAKTILLLAALLVVLQFFSVLVYGEVFFGVQYPTYIYPNSLMTFRYSPLNGDPNYFAYSLVPFVTVIIYYHFFAGQNGKVGSLYLFIGFVVVFFTMSRGALLALLACYLLLWLAKCVKKGVSLRDFLMVIFFIITFIFLLLYLSKARENNISNSSSQRIEILVRQVELVENNFLLGHGLDNTKVVIGDSILGPHNLFFEVLNGYGVIALLVFLIPIIVVIYKNKGVGRYLAISFILASSFLGLLIYHPMWVFYHFVFLKVKNKK